jgi:thiosulfate dehydrogenase
MISNVKKLGPCLYDLPGVSLLFIFLVIGFISCNSSDKPRQSVQWLQPDSSLLSQDENADLILYGKNLIVNTSFYIGPKGVVQQSSNGMNCQNCHLSAGTKIFGNNYSAVASTYPKYRGRSGKSESICKRINDCVIRSLNGKALDTLSREMQAIKMYISWLGKNVSKGEKPYGSGITELIYPEHAADTLHGKQIYAQKCMSCHSINGAGKLKPDSTGYEYPPLWGPHSYTVGAGLYRLSRLAGYIKSNMPNGADYNNPQLTDEEAWNIAAFINSQPRPSMNLSGDWPDISDKPADHPFGPYADTYSEVQHKYGPFGPIAEYKKKHPK